MLTKLDLRKDLKGFYNPSAKAMQVVEVPCFQFLMIDGNIETGEGPGTSPSFKEAMGALYNVSYTLKFMVKQRKVDPVDYPVMALEGLWWVEDDHFDINVKDNWYYTVMIMQPDLVTPDLFGEALAQVRKKKGDVPALARLRLEPFQEGLCVQVMHIGPYSSEPATVERMKAFEREHGLQITGRHHEIYMGNPLLAAPEKLKTILRHPVSRVS
jgi:hypothetical protein